MMLRWCVRVLLATLAVTGCSSDPDSPLGTDFADGGLIGSDPGTVFQDTVTITFGDSNFVTSAVLSAANKITVGRLGDTETAMLLRFNFSNATAEDKAKQVTDAFLSLSPDDMSDNDSFNVQFISMLDSLSNTLSDTLTSLNLAATAIPDPGNSGAVDRTMSVGSTFYRLEPDSVETWIFNEGHNGIAIVLMDATTAKELSWKSKEQGAGKPFLRVVFNDATETRYQIGNDGTFVTLLNPSSNLRISDGVRGRFFLPIDLSGFDTRSIVHDAILTLSVLPGSFTVGDQSVLIYAPTETSLAASRRLAGAGSVVTIDGTPKTVVRFRVREVIEEFIASPSTNHGLVVRFTLENSQIRQAEFFNSTAAPGLKPFLSLTLSDAPTFP
ncbi:MAG: hypothetical protein V3V49_09210 [Candidatus Krumholzibacteria bacterium]